MSVTIPAGASRQHVFSMAPLRVWLRLIADNGGVPRRYWGKLARVLGISALTAPLRVAERLCYGPSRMARVAIDAGAAVHPGIRPLGHHASAQPDRPGSGFRCRLDISGHRGADVPDRSRPAAARSCPGDARDTPDGQHGRVPRAAPGGRGGPRQHVASVVGTPPLVPAPGKDSTWTKYATMQLTGHGARALGSTPIVDVLRKATLASGGRRLVLKSPTNLGRTAELLRLFPDAKFIHIVRNPYVVYRSMTHLYRTMLPICQLDDVEPGEVAATILGSYAAMMRQYMHDRESIPAGHLAEVRFEDLERDPMAEVERLYAELALPGWEQARMEIAAYLSTLSDYRKNIHRIDRETIEVVDREWGFAVEAWGYRPPDGAHG